MIPTDISEWIDPQLADGTADAAILRHDCGVDFQFQVDLQDDNPFVVTEQHLKKWRTNIRKVAAIAGDNCFSYNTLEPMSQGVYHHSDSNTPAILFSPGTYLEHNEVEGDPILFLISLDECILTGSNSKDGLDLIEKHRKNAIADCIVTIDKKWQGWVKLPNVG